MPSATSSLGAAENKDDPAQALREFDRALALNADFAAAHSARGSLYYQMGNPEAALADLEAAASLRPDDAVDLDRLGQTYLALDRTARRRARRCARPPPGCRTIPRRSYTWHEPWRMQDRRRNPKRRWIAFANSAPQSTGPCRAGWWIISA